MSRRAVMRVICLLGLMAALLFVSAGRANLVFFWGFLGIEAFGWVLMLANQDQCLFQERIRPAPGGIDSRLRRAMTALFGLHLVIAGLDAGRFGWSKVPGALQVTALLGLAVAFGLTAWAQRVNSFFSPVVRIQAERGHHLVTDGPYRFVRHPGYLGVAALMILCGPALGSWWAMAPNVLAVVLLLRRAVIEDRFLHDHLGGYVDYAKRVRYRVLPGLW
jgi:protein-S-isoprenylcysteine O-methyltransferase Ste14